MNLSLLLLVVITGQSEPLRDSMRVYVAAFESASSDAEKLATAIRDRYPETWYTVLTDRPDSVTAVFGVSAARDTALVDTVNWRWRKEPRSGQKVLRFNYETMFFARDRIRAALQGLAPQVNVYLKTARIRDDLEVFTSLDTAAGTFKLGLDRLCGFFWAIRKQDTGFTTSLLASFDRNRLKSRHRWYKISLALTGMRIQQGLRRYEIRYGSTSEQLNIFEVVLSNAFPPCHGNSYGPSALEPIFLRVTPVCYNISDNRQAWLAQLFGMNCYLFGQDWFASTLSRIGVSHFGIAVAAADVADSPLLRLPALDSLAWGAMLHVGKFQFGVVSNFRSGFKLMSTVDVHIIPGFL